MRKSTRRGVLLVNTKVFLYAVIFLMGVFIFAFITLHRKTDNIKAGRIYSLAQDDVITSLEKKILELNLKLEELSKLNATRATITNVEVNSKLSSCTYGMVIPICPRKNKQGNETAYYLELIDHIPKEITHITISSRMGNKQSEVRSKFQGKGRKIFWIENERAPEFEFNDFVPRPRLRTNLNDKPKHVEWRSTLNLDFARGVGFMGEICKYVIWVEDDVDLRPGWFQHVLRITPPSESDWISIFLSNTGAVALLLNSKNLHKTVQYYVHRFDEMPLDWLLDKWDEFYRNHKGQTDSTWDRRKFIPTYRENIVGHRGEISSLHIASKRNEVY